MGSASGGQQPLSAGPRFGSTGLRSRDRYQLGRTDLKRGLPHATGRGEWSGGRGTQIRIDFVIMGVFLAFTEGRKFSGLA